MYNLKRPNNSYKTPSSFRILPSLHEIARHTHIALPGSGLQTESVFARVSASFLALELTGNGEESGYSRDIQESILILVFFIDRAHKRSSRR